MIYKFSIQRAVVLVLVIVVVALVLVLVAVVAAVVAAPVAPLPTEKTKHLNLCLNIKQFCVELRPSHHNFTKTTFKYVADAWLLWILFFIALQDLFFLGPAPRKSRFHGIAYTSYLIMALMLVFQGNAFIKVIQIPLGGAARGGAARGGAAKGDFPEFHKDISLDVQHRKYS